MTPLLLTALLAPAAEPAKSHRAANPLFASLTTQGLKFPQLKAPYKLPTPTLADGLTAPRQAKAVGKLIERDYPYREFLRPSVVGPILQALGRADRRDFRSPVKTLDVWFVAYGKLDAFDDEKFLDRLAEGRDGSAKTTTLRSADLKPRGIALDGVREDTERYAYVVADVLKRVQVAAVIRTIRSRTAESLVLASVVDPRFANDKQYPNRWRPLVRGEPGGEPSPYGGVGYYLKVTEMKKPAGALFVEAHMVFLEPRGWFGGANLLRSKLTPLVVSEARNLRTELRKAGR